MRFIDYVQAQLIDDTPLGDFVDDTQMLIRLSKFPEPASWFALETFMKLRHADPKAIAAGRIVWRTYKRITKNGPP